ncbi:hypothetical protein D9615_006168 [Tricholomella constricta]|uniref:Uncharacterized protein n=1 Tax=Tricholomella constricta TaxID=117010 RepID=A0A8H5M4A9_9AGAR|nr:hypothetical protein D9615_006168 [Tricholomella constricta]
MFRLISVSAPSSSYVLLGGPKGKEVVGPLSSLGPQGSSYILAFPGLGYIKLEDVGPNTSGPGDWAVKVSGSTNGDWTYGGEGLAAVSVDASGNYSITGGAKGISGKITYW